MTRTRPRIALLVTAMLACSSMTTGLALAGGEILECGIIREYTPPDPGVSADGGIAFGLSGPVEIIAADATLVGATATNLSSLSGGTPTCLTTSRDGGEIVSLEFAAEGTIAGPATFMPDLLGPGQDAYALADRLLVPAELLAVNSGLAALIKAPADNGTDSSITFQIDLDTGAPTSFEGTATISGTIVLLDPGDVMVGQATLSGDVVDASARAAFQEVAALGVAAQVTIHGLGSIDPDSESGVRVVITLGIDFALPSASPAATPVPSATPMPSAASLPDTALELAR